MGEQIHTLDNAGNIVPPDPKMAHPVAASGITITMTTSGNDYTQTLVEGETYALTFVATAGKVMFAGITGVTSTAANIEWVFVANQEYIIHIPIGKTTFYCECDESAKKAYLRKVAE